MMSPVTEIGQIVSKSWLSLKSVSYSSPSTVRSPLYSAPSESKDIFTPNYQPFSFMIVDDNEINIRILERILQRIFPNSSICTIQDSCLVESSELSQYEVIFLDIEMPQVTGVDIARDIRSKSALDNVGLIAVTTKSSQADLMSYEKCGFDFTFPKPMFWKYGEILRHIEQVMVDRSESGSGKAAKSAFSL